MRRAGALAIGIALLTTAGSGSGAAGDDQVFFDDFSHAGRRQLEAHGWVVRTGQGWPGVRGATWAKENISLRDDPRRSGNRLLRMSSSTNGTEAGSRQTQICHQRKYREGTYATRVRFRDAPTTGPDADATVETFYTISPLRKPMDPAYSEIDFEYLPNGGWGLPAPSLTLATWETFSPEPNWIADNSGVTKAGSRDGWHTLMLQVGGGAVRYSVDGTLLATLGGRYYPEVAMSINYNLWFIRDGLIDSRKVRRYDQDVDWVFHQADVVLSTEQVLAKIAALRRTSVDFRDTVVPTRLPSACKL